MGEPYASAGLALGDGVPDRRSARRRRWGLVGWWLIGRTWVAEELGIVLTAVAALVVGVRWATVGWREPAVAT
jgi:hypothetical protein